MVSVAYFFILFFGFFGFLGFFFCKFAEPQTNKQTKQMQGFGFSTNDQVKIVGSSDVCSTASAVSGVTLAQNTLSTTNGVIVTSATVAGTYKVCLQMSGQGSFVEVPGRLVVQGVTSMSPTTVAATGSSGFTTDVLLQGFGFTGADVVKIVDVTATAAGGSATTTPTCATGVATPNVTLFGNGLVSSNGAVTVTPRVSGSYLVCVQFAGSSGDFVRVPGTLTVAGGTGVTPNMVLPTSSGGSAVTMTVNGVGLNGASVKIVGATDLCAATTASSSGVSVSSGAALSATSTLTLTASVPGVYVVCVQLRCLSLD